jgi:predicted alpha/beta superfamily hydrolase
MIPRSKLALLVGLLAAPALAVPPGFERVEFVVTQETSFGDSVFLGGPIPELGAGDMTRSVKLSPHGYPAWRLAMELPMGLAFQPTAYLRRDGAADLPSAANGTTLSPPPAVATEPGPWRPRRIEARLSATDPASVRLRLSGVGFTPVELAPASAAAGVYTFEVPVEHVLLGREIQLTWDTAGRWPTDGPARLAPATLAVAHGQGFLAPPPAAPPTEPRRETFTFVPSRFNARTIRVLLPRDYDRDTTRRYPVVYTQDGQNVFEPGGAFGYWDLDRIVPRLVARGEIPEVILVGIDHADRFAEYIPEWGRFSNVTGRGGEFLAMIRDELMPEINERYRTATGPGATIHVGSSLGGLLGWEAAHAHAATFGTVIAMSPSFQISTTTVLEMADRPTRARLWIDSGTAGGSADGYANTITVRDRLVAGGVAMGMDFWHTVGLGASHNEAAWAARSPEALRWAFRPQLWAPPATPEGWMAR